MNNKKYIKIEILFCSIILIILLLTFLFYLFFTFNKQSAENQEDTIIGQENNTDNNKKSDIKNESDIEVTEETLKKLIEKINFPTYAIASLYNVKSFDLKTIPNDLILRLGWSKIDFSKQNILQDNNQSNAHTLLIPAETLNDKVLNIFGGFINYTDSSFINGNVKTFNNSMFTSNNVDYHSNYYKENDLDNITYYTDFYTTLYMDNHTDLSPFIHQEFQKFTKSENKISVYVCTCFVDTEFYENSNDIYFNIYKDFNFDKTIL